MSDMALQNLPEWDLSDLYQSMDDPQLQSDLDMLQADAVQFENTYKGTFESLSGDGLYTAFQEYERMSERMHKVMSYAGLLHATNCISPEVGAFYQNMMDCLTDISTHILFFDLEIKKLSDESITEKLASSDTLKYYETVIHDGRMDRQHQLSDAVEEILHVKSTTGASAWQRLFTQTMAGLQFNIDGQTLNESQVLTLMGDTNADTRKKATMELSRVLNDNLPVLSLITNTLAKDKAISDTFRGYPRPVSARNMSNLVEDEVVDALVQSVSDAYPDISHRYYTLKAKWMGVDTLQMWDRNAPLPASDDRIVPYADAVGMVLKSYREFSEDLYILAKQFFDNRWIDVGAKDGKRSGAFAHPCVPSVHPYLMLNYLGKNRDIMTLAHELGHGVHQMLASEQGYLKSQTPLILAETASVFGEMLTFRNLIDNETNPEKRRILLAGKVEDMINTVVRQISFYQFEELVHKNRRYGEISAEQLGEYWLQVSKNSLGDAFEYGDYYKVFWAYIPHFIHSPFYVYAYAFGDCLVNAIYTQYKNGQENFEQKYMDMLRSGGTKRHNQLVADFGLNTADPQFWKTGLSVIGGFIDELEETF